MKTIGIYCRVSTTEQAEKGYSLGSQIDSCKAEALKMGALEVIEYIDDGYSGAYLDRPAMSQMRDDIKEKKIDALVCYDPDRFARNLMHQLMVTEELEKAGIKLVFVNFEWKNTPEGKLFYSMRGAISEYEREKIKERTNRGKFKKAKSGKVVVPQPTIGYLWDKEAECYIIDEERAKVVHMIFEIVGFEKLSTREAAERLNSLGIAAPGAGTKKNPKGTWCKKTVGRIIQSRTYIGEYYFHRVKHIKTEKNGRIVKNTVLWPEEEWIKISVPSIIDRDIFERANKQLQRGASPRAKNKYLLYGMLTCAKCGRHFGGTTGSAGTYYKCYGTGKDGGKVCDSGMLNAQKTEEVIWEAIKETLKDPQKMLEVVQGKSENFQTSRDDAKLKLNEITEKLNDLENKKVQTLQWYRANLLTQEDVEKELQKIKNLNAMYLNEKISIEGRLKVHNISDKNVETLLNMTRQMSNKLDYLTWEQKREILELFINDIKVTVNKTNSKNSEKTFDIDGLIKLHNETSIVGEVPQTYFSVNLDKKQNAPKRSFIP